MPRKKILGTAVAASLAGAGIAQAGLVNDWIADNYSGSGSWTDSQSSVVATPTGTPVKTAAAFGTHAGINFNGNSNFVAPGTGTAPGGSTSWTIAAVYKVTGTTAGAAGGQFWQGSGLIGNEEGGSPNDFGLSVVGTDVSGGGGFNGGDRNLDAGTTTNVIHAAALVADATAGTLTLYQDGVQIAQNTGIAVTDFGARDANGFGLGAVTTGNANQFPGLVAELQTYNSAVNGATLTSTLRATYVPEPASVGLLGFIAAGFMSRRRRS